MDQNSPPYKWPGARPKVIIVGAGLGGLTLGLLLEKAGVDYTILERASTVKPLGMMVDRYLTLLCLTFFLNLTNDYLAISFSFARLRIRSLPRFHRFGPLQAAGYL